MSGAAAAGILGLFMSFMMGWAVWYVLILISRWKVFDKAGIAGWKSLIPIYSDYCTYKISWRTTYFWVELVAGMIAAYASNQISSITEAGNTVPAMLSLVSFVAGAAVTILNLLMNINLARRFGHGTVFGIGLTFLTPIFTMILGLGSSDYYGNPAEGLPPRRVRYM